jgi:hypothetical protein
MRTLYSHMRFMRVRMQSRGRRAPGCIISIHVLSACACCSHAITKEPGCMHACLPEPHDRRACNHTTSRMKDMHATEQTTTQHHVAEELPDARHCCCVHCPEPQHKPLEQFGSQGSPFKGTCLQNAKHAAPLGTPTLPAPSQASAPALQHCQHCQRSINNRTT